jgi:site-specific recombinase XerD
MQNFARYNRALVKRYEQWMIAMHYARSTQHTYKRTLYRFAAFMGSKSVAQVSHVDIQKYLARISEDGVPLTAAYRDLGVLRLFYDFLNLGGVVNYVAPRFVRLRRPLWNSPGVLTEGQVQKLIAVAQTPRERALVEFLYGTGCRLAEVRTLKVQDVDLDARCARVRGKLGKVRIVLFTETARDALRAYIGERDSGYVFRDDRIQKGCLMFAGGQWKLKYSAYTGPHRTPRQKTKCLGSLRRMSFEEAQRKHQELASRRDFRRPERNRPLSQEVVQAAVKSLAHRAGLKKVTPHTLRRTFATHLYNRGAGVDVIKALMGHVWIQTTMRYARISQDRLSKAVDQFHPRESFSEQTSE